MSNKIIIITGGANGLGYELVKQAIEIHKKIIGG